MAIKLVKTEWGAYDKDMQRQQICEFMCDSEADFASLPPCAPGSVALAPSGDMKIVNASRQWVDFGG